MAAGQSPGTMNAGRIVQVKKVGKVEAITGLSIPQVANTQQFRTKANTLVATGYEKVQRDENGVVTVHFKANQVYQRNLIEVEPAKPLGFQKSSSPGKYNSRDDAKVQFQCHQSVAAFIPDHWTAAAADLYVDGVPVYVQTF